ncbi:MAG: flagellar export chaperone FliS [Candidatus Latescibacterota bacterium]|jgi:flagellar protein FliS|nr:flagellar export chaperone FliS [Candidatus Latescibacterota bacterium]
MPQSNVYGQYRQVQISTASPGKLILLLYQGAIKALKKANELIDRKEFGEKGDQLIKAQDIIMELNLALDMKAGEISVSLQQIYMYAYRKLVVANLEVDKDGIQEVIGLLENLYEAWEVAVQSTEGTLPGAAPAMPKLSVTG